jgi:CDP-paratose 2-epimerase
VGFLLTGARTFYGTTKLAVELLVAEYVESFGLRGIVNRCGVQRRTVADGHR